MSGLTERFSAEVQDQRVKEYDCSLGFRRISAAKNTIGILPTILGPVTAFIIFALLLQNDHGSRLDPTTAFTSLSLISLLSSPIFPFMFAFPQFTASMGCYDRIQEYLVSGGGISSRSSSDFNSSSKPISLEKVKGVSSIIALESIDTLPYPSLGNALLVLENATFSFKVGGKPVLKDLTFSLLKSSMYMLIGPVGCGKSSILLAMLEELDVEAGTL